MDRFDRRTAREAGPDPRESRLPFLWGAATSAYQIEGGNSHSDWSRWEKAEALPHADTAERACDHWNRMEEDLGWIETLGLNAYRFSVEWSRLEPAPGAWDEDAFERYAWLARECRRRGIMAMVTLHHFTSPAWFAERGGFLRSANIRSFCDFVERVARRLGNDVSLWITFNEPAIYASAGYIAGRFPPGDRSLLKGIRATRNMQRAHEAAYRILHEHSRPQTFRGRSFDVAVGIAQHMLALQPLRRGHPADRVAAVTLHRFLNEGWLNDLVPARSNAQRRLDFIGVNYYTAGRAEFRPSNLFRSKPMVDIHLRAADGPRSDLGWTIEPDGLRRALASAGRYGLPLIVTENGIADASDRLRRGYIAEHLTVIARHVGEGGDVRGYFHWSLMDNFEWLEGYDAKFGLLAVDRTTLDRTERASAGFYRDVIREHRADDPPDETLIRRVLE